MMKIILCGPSCSGKTAIKQELVKQGLVPGVSYTTRTPREGEIDGKDYKFVSKQRFNQLINDGFFFEYDDSFDDFYGTSNDDFNSCDVFILTPKAISSIIEQEKIEQCFIVHLTAPVHVRISRASERGDGVRQILKRITSDCSTFTGFSDYHMSIDTSEFGINDIIERIKK